MHLYSLPNEVFVQILSSFSTRQLLPLTTVSHRFHALVLRILHYRLLVAASLKEYRLILECFHPSSKLTEPHVFCDYLGTDGLSDRHEGQGSLYENVETAQHLARLSALYSRFRPRAQPDDEAAVRRVDESPLSSSDPSPPSGNRAVMLPGVVGYLRPKPKRRDDGAAVDEHSVKRIVSLDESEDFSQLCVVANIVKVLRGSNLLLSAVTVEDGIVRIWRKWLKDRVSQSQLADAQTGLDLELDSSQARHRPSAMLWVDEGKNVGLKLRVEEKRWNRNRPVLMHRDEEPLVSYQVEIQELHIRTTRLLMTVEQSLEEDKNYTNAIIFGAFHSTP